MPVILIRFNADSSRDNLKDIVVPSVPPQGAGPSSCVPVNQLAGRSVSFSTRYADANLVPRGLLPTVVWMTPSMLLPTGASTCARWTPPSGF